MNNIQKSFRNKAKMGLHMATGGFISTVPDAGFGGRSPGMANTSPFDNGGGTITGLGGGLQRMSLGGGNTPAAIPSTPAPAGGLQPNQPQNKLDGQIALGNAVGNSNMTMGEKAALGLGTTAADASALRTQTSALTSLRDGMAQNMADGGVVETPDQLMARMAAKYGGGAAAATRPAEPAPAPQAAAPTPAPQSGGLLQRAVRGMSNRAAQIVPQPYVGHAERDDIRQRAGLPDPSLTIAGNVVDSVPYAAAQFVPALNVPLGGFAGLVHAVQGRSEELPMDAMSMLPGGKGVSLAKGVKRAASKVSGRVGRSANAIQALDSAGAAGANAYAEGGIVRGKGGVDKVPMNISGVDVNLTGGKTPEAVLPSKTVQALGGPEEVEELIERTNGKPPVKSGLRAGGSYAKGAIGWSNNWPANLDLSIPDAPQAMQGEYIPAQQTPPAQSVSRAVVPTSGINSNLNERVGARGPTIEPGPAPYKPNWQPGYNGSTSVTPYNPNNAVNDAAAAARDAKQASVIKQTVSDANKFPGQRTLESGARMAGEYGGKALESAKAFGRALAPAAELAVPLMAAYDANYGNDAIRVNSVRDPNTSFGDALSGLAKQTALRVGDWGTKGLDALASPGTAVLNVGAKTLGSGQRFNYNAANDFYRQGMRNGVSGISAPASLEYAQPAALTPEQQAHQRILNDPTGGVGKIPGLMTPQQKQAAITVNAPVQAEAIQSAKDQPNEDVYQRVTGEQPLPKGLRASIDQGGGRRLDFNSPNNVANQTIDARRYQADGEGVASMRQPDGSFRNVVLGASGNAQPQGPVRLDAHGNNMAATDQMQNTLRNMQHDRLMRDLGGDIKDPRVTQAAMLGLNQMNKDAELGNERSRYAGEQAYKIADLGLRRDQNKLSQANIDADNRRADATLRDKQVGEVDKTLSDMIEKIVPTAGLKDDDLKTAQVKQAEIRQATLEAYGGQLPPDVATLQKDLVGRVTQGRLTANANEAMRKRGPIDKLRNLFSGNVRPTTSLSPNTDLGDRDWLRLEYAGVPLFPDDVFHGDADLMAAYDERRAKQRELKTLKNNAAR